MTQKEILERAFPDFSKLEKSPLEKRRELDPNSHEHFIDDTEELRAYCLRVGLDPDKVVPTVAERLEGIVVKNACECLICGAKANRYSTGVFVCQKNVGHIALGFSGFFTNCSKKDL